MISEGRAIKGGEDRLLEKMRKRIPGEELVTHKFDIDGDSPIMASE
jgi:hypothetical protein